MLVNSNNSYTNAMINNYTNQKDRFDKQEDLAKDLGKNLGDTVVNLAKTTHSSLSNMEKETDSIIEKYPRETDSISAMATGLLATVKISSNPVVANKAGTTTGTLASGAVGYVSPEAKFGVIGTMVLAKNSPKIASDLANDLSTGMNNSSKLVEESNSDLTNSMVDFYKNMAENH